MNSLKIGQRVRECRLSQNMTQQILAERADISPRYLGDIECGAKVPRLETFIRILNALNTSADFVLMDVLNSAYTVRATVLSEKLEDMSADERSQVLRIFESILEGM